MKNLQEKEELDIHGQSILNLLREDGKGIFECDPDILLVMVQKANILIESQDYIDIIKVWMEKFPLTFRNIKKGFS